MLKYAIKYLHLNMLLILLLAFGLLGIASRYFVSSRPLIIFLLSTGSIAILSPASLLSVAVLALINYPLIAHSKKKVARNATLIFNLLFLLLFHLYSYTAKEFTQSQFPVVVGFSFLVLQLIDHSFKVYYKQFLPPQNFLSYFSSVFYLPKFFSGPVASLPDVAIQIHLPAAQSTAYGLNRILLGLFKKLVLAESIAPMVHSVQDFGDGYPGLTVLSSACLYSLQLYFDFSGYSDIAIGVSAMWGIELPENFNFPFRQKSWGDFWKSWHSSLTTWLWQYIFNPVYLSFSRKNTNKIVAGFICALLVFGGMAFFNGIQPGFYLSAGILALFYFLGLALRLKGILNQYAIFLIFSVALIYFRNPGIEDLFSANFIPQDWLVGFLAPLASGGSQQDYFNLTITLVLAFTFLLFERKIFSLFSAERINYAAWFVLGILLFVWGVFESGERFIYMQF